ncbi:MAG TPA: hypothetical protein VD971_06590 [Phycisphaerales bacterium]|nr:hypothetical protein [Phycisphaerales bacterium]
MKQHIEKFDQRPARIAAAMEFVQHCLWITDPPMSCGPHDKGRDLTPREQAAYDAALDALRLYVACEQDFGGPPVRTEQADAGDAESPRCKKCRKLAAGE